MENIEIKCYLCGCRLKVEDRFKKVICPTCGNTIEIQKGKKNIEEQKKKEDTYSELERLDKAEDLIKDGQFEKAERILCRLKEQGSKEVMGLKMLLHVHLETFNGLKSPKLWQTDEKVDETFWLEIRSLLKEYYDLDKVCDSKTELYGENDYEKIQVLIDYYKKMLLEMEQCCHIEQILQTQYLDVLQNKEISRKRKISGESFLYELLGAHINKMYSVRRNLVLYYKHSRTKKHVYSRLHYMNLDDLENALNDKLPTFNAIVKEKKRVLFKNIFLSDKKKAR